MRTKLLLSSLFLFTLLLPTVSFADAADRSLEGLKEIREGTEHNPDVTLADEFEFGKSLLAIAGVFINLIGFIFFALTIYGGFVWMKAWGNEDEITRAKKIIRQAVIGLMIVLAAKIISLYVIESFGFATGS
ncbi:hypothetical protein CL634_04460 [bacterium]|nr:hypothetical protein [bacterium]|tara:strand:- start:502 stop:897 length:396 start_codon:yes stop_codon:yes gene_type:complete